MRLYRICEANISSKRSLHITEKKEFITMAIFNSIPTIKYEGPKSKNPLAFKYYDADGKTTLDPEDDTAQTLWGDDWRTPTQAEMKELMERCTWTWCSVNGVYGYRVSGNGNSIFLPAAGSQYEDIFTSQGTQGCYMSATLYTNDYGYEVCMGFNKKDRYSINSDRYDGHTIRPVKK